MLFRSNETWDHAYAYVDGNITLSTLQDTGDVEKPINEGRAIIRKGRWECKNGKLAVFFTYD